MKKKKIILIAVIALLIIVGISILLWFILGKKDNATEENKKVEIDKQLLELNFSEIFDNQGNEYIKTWYDIDEEDAGKYKITAVIPFVVNSENESETQREKWNKMSHEINKDINDIFVSALLKIYKESNKHTILQIKYATAINDNILSIMIKCIFKDGANAQRTIIKTYNYEINECTKVSIADILSEEEKKEVQEEINKKIEKEIEKEQRLAEQGYSSYTRDAESEIYKVENATEFYIKDNILYLIYSYGNGNYTSVMDLILYELQ